MIHERIRILRDAGEVTRSHTCRRLINRSVAEHSYGMAIILMQLVDFHANVLGEKVDIDIASLLQAALVHDLSEIETGDVPAPTKWKYPALRKELNAVSTTWEDKMRIRYPLTTEQQELLSWVDMVEFLFNAIEEVTLGNKFFVQYMRNAHDNLLGRRVPVLLGNGCYSLRKELSLQVQSL